MSIPDELIISYFELLTNISSSQIKKYEEEIKIGKANPRDIKAILAFEIVKMYHGEKEASNAQKEFENIFRKGGLPSKIPTKKIRRGELGLVNLLMETELVKSKSEARRLIEQGGVEIDGKVIKDREAVVKIKEGMVMKVGKRRFVKISKS
jgi:tyrosyl-tRNA synthetase